jgi:hypothetical protein
MKQRIRFRWAVLSVLCASAIAATFLIAYRGQSIGGWSWQWFWHNRWRLDSGPVWTTWTGNPNETKIPVGRYYTCGPVLVMHRPDQHE